MLRIEVKWPTVLRKLLEYTAVLVVAGAVGFGAGHWGNGRGPQGAPGARRPVGPQGIAGTVVASADINARLAKLERTVEPTPRPTTIRTPTGEVDWGALYDRKYGQSRENIFSLGERVQDLEATVNGLDNPVDAHGDPRIGSSLQARISALEVHTGPSPFLVGVTPLEARVSALERSVSDLQSRGRGY